MFYQILSPDKDDNGVWIHQNAWFSLGAFSNDTVLTYKLKSPNNGLYVFIIKGSAIAAEKNYQKETAWEFLIHLDLSFQ